MDDDQSSVASERTARLSTDRLGTATAEDGTESILTHVSAYTDARSAMTPFASTVTVDKVRPATAAATEATQSNENSGQTAETIAMEIATQIPMVEGGVPAAGGGPVRRASSENTAVHLEKDATHSKKTETDTIVDPLAHFNPEERKIIEAQNYLPPERRAGFGELFRFQTRVEVFLNILGIVAAVATGVAQPLMTVVFGSLTNSFVGYFSVRVNDPQADTRQLKDELFSAVNQDALYLFYIGIAVAAATWFYSYVWIMSGERTTRRIREQYLRAVLRQNCAYFDNLGPGETTTRLISDTQLVQEAISDKIPQAASFVAMFFAGFIIAFIRNWLLALALCSVVPVIGIAGFLVNKWESKLKTKQLANTAQGGSLAEEVLSSARNVVAFGMQKRLIESYEKTNAITEKLGFQSAAIKSPIMGVFFFSVYGIYGLGFYFGTTLILDGRSNSGQIVSCIFSIMIGAFSLAQLAPIMTSIANGQGAASKIFDTIDRVPPIDSAETTGAKPEINGDISLKNITFYYPSRPTIKVLDDITLHLPKGSKTALVGASGGGKSSIVGLLERLYDPIRGRIEFDGLEIKDINLRHLRRNIGLVTQEPTLFAGTVSQNVAHGLLGNENLSADEIQKLVIRACQQANAHDFILALPNGYDSDIGERGGGLSGGQKQRIAIARAIVNSPPILVLDEATSALDTTAERIVQEALEKVSEERTTLTIAHRLSTIQNSDNIVVLVKGQIVESGKHNELLQLNGAYSKLVTAQALREEAPEVEKAQDDAAKEMVALAEAEAERKILRRPTMMSVASGAPVQDSNAPKHSAISLFRRIGRLNKNVRTLYGVGVFATFLSGVTYPAYGIVFGKLLELYSTTDRGYLRSQANLYSLILFLIGLAATAGIVLQTLTFGKAAESQSRILRRTLFAQILRQDIKYFDIETNGTGSLVSHISDWPQRVHALYGDTLAVIIQNVFTIVAGCIIGLVFEWRLALVGISLIPVALSVGILRLNMVILKDKKTRAAHEKSAAVACESAAAIRTVSSLTKEDHAVQEYHRSLDAPHRESERVAIYSNLYNAIGQAVSFWIIALIFWYGSRLLVNNGISTGQFFTCLISVIFAAIQAGQIFIWVGDISGSTVASASIVTLLESEPGIDADSQSGICKALSGDINIRDVHFRYPSRPEVRCLRGVDIEVQAGQFIGICGPSGSGKSTLIQLIERFYDPATGTVECDGHNIKNLNLSNYRSQIALVAQEPTLYNGSIKDNILLGTPSPEKVSDAAIWQACEDANIASFIRSLPEGLDTQLGSKAVQLSGGQRQRCCIARALIRNPKVLLLDEATSALDSESERIVQEALDKARLGRSTIAIAHRLSSIQAADKIYVLSEGRVVESGTHNQLLAKKGLYNELVNQQALEKRR